MTLSQLNTTIAGVSIYLLNYDERDRTTKSVGSLSILSHLNTQLIKYDKIHEAGEELASIGIHISKFHQLEILTLRILGSAIIMTCMIF